MTTFYEVNAEWLRLCESLGAADRALNTARSETERFDAEDRFKAVKAKMDAYRERYTR